MKALPLSLFLFFYATFAAFPQVGGLVNYTQEDGLNASYTYRFSQDGNGFIWIGSDNGLFRFDGASFRQYNQKDGLENIDILQTRPLSDGSNLVFAFQDLALIKNGKVHNKHNDVEIAKIKPGKRFSFKPFFNPASDEIMITQQLNPEQLFFFKDGKTSTVPVKIDYKSISSDFCSLIAFDFRGYAYFSRSRDIFRYDIYTARLELMKGRLVPDFLGTRQLNANEIAAYYQNRVEIVDVYRNSRRIAVFPKGIFEVNITGSYLWVSFANGGACCYDLNTDPGLNNPIPFMDGYILNDIFMDGDGNIWFSTKNKGIFFLAKRFFLNYCTAPIPDNLFNVTAISGDSQAIIMGYDNGTAGVYSKGRITHFSLGTDATSDCRAVFLDEHKAIIGLTKGVYSVSMDALQARKVPGSKNWPSDYLVKNIVPDNQRSIMICTGDGLCQFNLDTETSQPIIAEKSYTALRYDPDSLFFGNFSDLYKLCISTGRKKLFLSARYFTDIKPLAGNLYAGATNGYGIFIFDNSRILRRISESDGLASNQVKRIAIQNGKVIWAATNSGLCRIDLSKKKVTLHTFTRLDGLPSDRVAGCVLRNDTVFAGTAKGLAVLPIADLLGQQIYVDKKVVITSVTIGRKELTEPKGILKSAYPENNIAISLAYPDYPSQGKVSYRYKINGLNEEWQTGESAKIVLNALQPGAYKLIVYGISYNGRRSRFATVFRFEIEPCFWQAWWFKSLLLAIGGVCIALIVQYILQRRRGKKLRGLLYDKKIAELELQAIKAQINPHFIYNCLNSIQFLLHKNGYSEESRRYLNSFAKLIRKTLHYSEKTFMPLSEEVEYLDLYLQMEKIRFKSHFDYAIAIDKSVSQNWQIPSLLVQPFVENAIKHGIANLRDRQGHISIRFEFRDPSLCITIRDNGVGISDAALLVKKMDSFGIKLSQKRIDTFRQLFDTDIKLEINDLSRTGGHGTEIKIYLNQNEPKN